MTTQPFDTAPRDGRLFWAWHQHYECWDVMRFCQERGFLIANLCLPWEWRNSVLSYTDWAPLDTPAAP